jgi:hypothetical protein
VKRRPRNQLSFNLQLIDSKNKSNQLYEIESIIDMRFSLSNEKIYLVKWKGFSITQSTWEMASNLNNCDRLIEDFQRKMNNPSHAFRQKQRKLNRIRRKKVNQNQLNWQNVQ